MPLLTPPKDGDTVRHSETQHSTQVLGTIDGKVHFVDLQLGKGYNQPIPDFMAQHEPLIPTAKD